MKGAEHFKDVIQNYLETRASYDELFAENFRKENKNIDECITYILTEVQRMGCADLSDEEVYSLAMHYYDEDNIEAGKSINLVKSFQSAYVGSYASKEDFAEELVRMENDLSDFALSYFDFSEYADDLFDTDYWYKNGYVFRNE